MTADGANRKLVIHDAIDFLMEQVGDQIEAHLEAVASLHELNSAE